MNHRIQRSFPSLFTALLSAAVAMGAGCAGEEDDHSTESDALEVLEGIIEASPVDALAAPSGPAAGLVCEDQFDVDDVWDACENAYDQGEQIGQCYLNICSCYTCVE